MRLWIANGISDFRELREQKFEYIDKSHLISEFIDRDGHKAIVLPRPRRFGKTLNLTMLKWFFEKREENLWHLFEDLHIGRAGEAYKAHFQQYPVIHLSFKETKADSFEGCIEKIKGTLQRMVEPHYHTLERKLSSANMSRLQAIMDGTVNQFRCEAALLDCTEWLHVATGKRPIVLIDEYDAPIHAGFSYGYYDKISRFCFSFYEAGLKDNPHLERAVMTGILRTANESIFSGWNNPGVYSLLELEFSTCFGFTESEVFALLQKAELVELMENVRAHYDGYEFGAHAIYNPWSILEFLASESKQLVGYWANTSENMLVKQLLHRHAFAIEKEVYTLLEGGTIERRLNDNIVFTELERQGESLWNILVFSGYLKAARPGPIVVGQPRPPFLLSIPNIEVAEIFRTTFQAWMNQGLNPGGGSIEALTTALLTGDVDEFEQQLQKFVAFLPSYHDVRGAKPEQFYHGLMIGLLATLEPDYEVRSNRESGEGRPDVMIKPRRSGKPGVVLELKAAGTRAGRTLTQAMNEGLRQIAKNDYTAELRGAGITPIHSMAIAFDGKNVLVKPGGAPLMQEKPAATKATKKAASKGKRK